MKASGRRSPRLSPSFEIEIFLGRLLLWDLGEIVVLQVVGLCAAEYWRTVPSVCTSIVLESSRPV
jgi:hypothetical protein